MLLMASPLKVGSFSPSTACIHRKEIIYNCVGKVALNTAVCYIMTTVISCHNRSNLSQHRIRGTVNYTVVEGKCHLMYQ